MLQIKKDCVYAYAFIDILCINETTIHLLYKHCKILIEGEKLCIISFVQNELMVKGTCINIQFIYANV